jgi:hypothetical protein
MRKPVVTHAAVAIAALVVGVAATAGAAKLIDSGDIKNGTIKLKDLSKKAQDSLKGQIGPSGPPGATGPQGPQGQGGSAGADGTNGTPGASGVAGPTIFASSIAVDNSWSTPGSGGNFGTEASAQLPVPPGSAFTAKSFVATTASNVAGNTVTVAFRINGADTTLKCTIPIGQKQCVPAGNPSVVVPEGSQISMHTLPAPGATPGVVGYAFRGEF